MVSESRIYVWANDHVVLEGDATPEDLDAILHRNMVKDNKEEIEKRQEHRKSELRTSVEKVRGIEEREDQERQPSTWFKEKQEERELSEFHPAGELRLLTAGHSEEGEFRLRIDVTKKPFNLEHSLLGACCIGSSNYLWQTVLPIAEKEKGRKKRKTELPQLLMYKGEEGYREAVYDVKTGKFTPTNDTIYSPRDLTLLDRPCIQASYYRPDRVREEVRIHRNVLEYAQGKLNERREETHGRSAFACMLEDSGRTRSEIEAAIPTLFYMSADQVREVGKTLSQKELDRLDFTEYLNRFLLYNAFMQTNPKGSFIVGQIRGDSDVMHLPYVQVI